MDDTSELSGDEEFALANKVYKTIWTDRPWVFAQKAYAGTTSGSATLSLPSDISFVINKKVFVGPTSAEYELVPWADRREYTNKSGYCWLDHVNSNLVFSVTPDTGLAVDYDYVFMPSDLTTGQSWAFPTGINQDIIYHGMCVDNFIIQQSEKAKSYAKENQEKYEAYLKDIAYWNAQRVL